MSIDKHIEEHRQLGLLPNGHDQYNVILASDAPGMIDDFDLTNGLPSGWSEQGTGPHDYDGDGWSSPDGYILLENYAGSADIEVSGTIIVEYERRAAQFDWPTRKNGDFVDGIGGNQDSAGNYYILSASDQASYNKETWLYVATSATTSALVHGGDLGDLSKTTSRPCAHPGGHLDPKFATFRLTWNGTEFQAFDDGVLIDWGTWTPDATRFQRMAIGARLTGRDLLGGWKVRRLQISRTPYFAEISSAKIAVLGDSLTQGYTAMSTPTDTVAGYDAAQKSLTFDAAFNASTNAGNGINEVWHHINSRNYLLRGKWTPVYNASHSGWEYRTDLPNTFSTAQQDAIAAYDPDLICFLGSVNDINAGTPTTVGFRDDIEAYIKGTVAKCASVSEVKFYLTFATPKTYAAGTPGYLTEWAAQQEYMQQLALRCDNLSGDTIDVEFIDATNRWFGVDGTQEAEAAFGSHPENDYVKFTVADTTGFLVGETVAGSTSGAEATVDEVIDATTMWGRYTSANAFDGSETIVGQTSATSIGATTNDTGVRSDSSGNIHHSWYGRSKVANEILWPDLKDYL